MQVGRLRCLRGIDTLTAAGLCAEIADFERFAKAEQLMSYVGLIPCENTTGGQRRLGAISWSAQQRLHRTWQRLEQRGKRRTIIAVAGARELAGFCWAICRTE